MNSLLVFGLFGAIIASSNAVMQKLSEKSSSEPIQVSSVRKFGANLNIIELADRLNAYNFLFALEETNLTDSIRNAHDVTVFIPTNAAWNALSSKTRDYLRANPKEYQNLVKYHVVQGRFPEKLLQDEEILTTLYENRKARFNIYNHTNIPDIRTFMGSVLNPTNNFTAANGFIHLIDEVVEQIQTTGSTFDLVTNSSELSKLTLLIKAAHSDRVVSLLKDTTHTLFAPNNKAFKKIPSSLFDRILKDPMRAERIVLEHITERGTYFANGIIDGEQIPTVDLVKNISVKKDSSGNIRLNDRANVIGANNSTNTGVVHIIDELLWQVRNAELN